MFIYILSTVCQKQQTLNDEWRKSCSGGWSLIAIAQPPNAIGSQDTWVALGMTKLIKEA